jgi:hypothetical protein
MRLCCSPIFGVTPMRLGIVDRVKMRLALTPGALQALHRTWFVFDVF